MQQEDPFPLLALPDLVLQHVLTFLSLLERKAVRATCRKLCKVASAAVRHFHVERNAGDTYLEYLSLHEKFPNVQVISLANELVCDRPFAALVTLTLCKLKNLCSLVLLNSSMALSAAGVATLCQCRHIKQLVMAPPCVSKGPLMAANTQAIMTMLGQLPGLTHLLLLPSQQQDAAPVAVPAAAAAAAAAAAGGVAAAGLAQQGAGLMPSGRGRDWQLSEPALRCLSCLHGLVQLELGCDPAGLSDLACLAGLSNLRRLALRGLSLEAGERLGTLTGLGALRSLSLVDGSLGEDCLALVGRCTKLTRLELQGCHRLREAALTQLIHLHQLACFRCSMPLTESGLSLLVAAAGSRLALLEADSIEIVNAEAHPTAVTTAAGAGGAAGAAAVALNAAAPPALPAAAAGGAAAAAAAAAAGPDRQGSAGPLFGQLGPQLPGLRVLVLRRLPSSSPQLWQLAPGLTSLVVWGEGNNAGMARAFSSHCALQRLVLNCEATSDAGLAAVASLSRLRDLTLCEGRAVSPWRLVSVVRRLPQLQPFCLHVVAVASLSRLRDLTLCEGRAVSPWRLVSVVRRLPQLQVLQLSHMPSLCDDSLAHLVAAARQLRVLGLQEPGRVSEQGFALLGALPQLTTLWVDCCKLSMAVLMALGCSPSLCLLEVHQSHLEAETLGFKQLELLNRVKGPRLEVVLREGARSREELLRPLLVPGGVLSHNPYAGASGGFGSEGSGGSGGVDAGRDGGGAVEPSVGFGVQELVLDHGLMVGGTGPARGLMGQGSWQVGLVGGANGLQGDEQNAWPDIAGMHL
uniref:F-box domain-containing protein n=1 Tax=Tetradesmus obliquus TaxID=3088 RepID=A0A383V6V6_TETOB|eukprot:jgi/Sobl393_1/3965/SZX60459.1